MRVIVELFGKEVEVVEYAEDEIADPCWSCALQRICQVLSEHLDTFDRLPCRRVDGHRYEYFKDVRVMDLSGNGTWSKEDEDNLFESVKAVKREYSVAYGNAIGKWLNSLKERLQQK